MPNSRSGVYGLSRASDIRLRRDSPRPIHTKEGS